MEDAIRGEPVNSLEDVSVDHVFTVETIDVLWFWKCQVDGIIWHPHDPYSEY